MKKILKKYDYIFFLFLILLVTYSIRIIIPVIGIDTEAYINNPKEIITSWYSIGRFSLGYYIKVFHLNNFNIVFNNIIASLLFLISIIILVESLIKDNKKLKIIFASLIITSPLFAEQYAFTLQNIEVMLSFLLLIISIQIINRIIIFKQNKLLIPISILLIILAFGTYQAFYMLYITLVIIYFIHYYDNLKTPSNKIKAIVKYIAILIICALLTMIVAKITNSILNVESTSYLKEQMNWINGNFKKGILYSGYYICEVLLGLGIDNNLGFTIIAILIIIYLYKNKLINEKLLTLSYLLLLLSPFLISIFFGTLTFNRSQFSIPIILAFLYTKFSSNKKILIISIILIIVQSISTIYLFNIDVARYNLDKKIINSIKKIDNKDNLPIIFVNKGHFEHKYAGETLGKSFFKWDYKSDKLSNDRIKGLANAIGVKYKTPTVEQIQEAKNKKYKKYINYEQDYIVIDINYFE